MARSGQDPAEMPPRRVLNVAWTLFLEDYPREKWDEVTEAFDLAFASDDVRAEHATQESDTMVRASASALGVDVDRMAAAAMAARRAALEERERQRAAGTN